MPEFGSERILVGKPDHHLGLVLVKFENTVMRRPSLSARVRNDSAASLSNRARPSWPSASQAGCATRERSTMPGMSSGGVTGTSPTRSPVAGL